jgi:hypothetical protein
MPISAEAAHKALKKTHCGDPAPRRRLSLKTKARRKGSKGAKNAKKGTQRKPKAFQKTTIVFIGHWRAHLILHLPFFVLPSRSLRPLSLCVKVFF